MREPVHTAKDGKGTAKQANYCFAEITGKCVARKQMIAVWYRCLGVLQGTTGLCARITRYGNTRLKKLLAEQDAKTRVMQKIVEKIVSIRFHYHGFIRIAVAILFR